MCARSGKWCGIVLILLLGISGPYASEAQHPGIGIGACGGIMNFMSDISPEKMGFLGEASLDLPFSRNFSAILTGGFGKQNFSQDNQSLATQLTTIDLKGAYRLSLSPSVHPMLYLGFGVINFKHADLGRYWDGMGIAGAGLDLSLGKSLGFQILADYRYTSGDDFDGVAEGGNDPYFSAKAGINYRLPSKNKFKEES
jgi:hypothetical protein